MSLLSKHLGIAALILAVGPGCGEGSPESPESLDEVLSRYEAEGSIEFLTPHDQVTGEPLGPPSRDAFVFLSTEAEARFADERGLHIATEARPLSVSEWFCYGGSSGAVNGTLVTWLFFTQNNSTRMMREANVTGRIYHPGGATMSCTQNASNTGNACTIYSTVASGYNSAVGTHECCEKRGVFGAYVCTNIFASTAQL